MSRALIVRKIQDVLNANGKSDHGPAIAIEFATIVNLVNRRLDTCKMYLDLGQLGEAMRIAEERPPLFEMCAMLAFDRLAMWQSMCKVKGWQEPEPLKLELAQELSAAFMDPAALNALVELNRAATQAQDLRMSVRCLRRLVTLDPRNTTWQPALTSFEGRYMASLKDQFLPAVALKNTATMHRIAEEIEAGGWTVPVDSALLSGIAEMRNAEKILPPDESDPTGDTDLFQTTPDEEPKGEKKEPPKPKLEVTTTKIDDARVEGWTPNPKTMLIACLILALLVVGGVLGIFLYGRQNYKLACEKLQAQNQQVLVERGGKAYEEIKGKIEKGEYKEAHAELSKLIEKEGKLFKEMRRKAAEEELARKQAEEVALEKKKADDAEAERKRIAEEKRKKEEEEALALKRKDEELRQKQAEAEAERVRQQKAEAERLRLEKEEAERQRLAELERKKAEAAEVERQRLEALARKKAEEAEILRQQREEDARMQNSGFDSEQYMVIDLSGGANAPKYPVTYYKDVADLPGGVQDDIYKTSKMLLRYIAPGKFMMGSPKDQLGHDDTQPVVETAVTNGYFIGVFEVTQRQWELVMGKNPSYFEDSAASATRPVEQVSCYEIRENAKTNKDDPDSNWPKNNYVNEESFMGRLRLRTGIRTFDLPTEVQWEYACRAGTTTSLNSGKNISNMYIDNNVAEVGRYYSNGGRGYKRDGTIRIMTAPVGAYKPNAWGLFDMHGNVSEWCLDSYRLAEHVEPQWKGKVNDQYCVLRGGGWDNVAWHCLATSRNSTKPFQRNYNAGFRIVRNKASGAEPKQNGHR